ncbi:MAG: hypothetical protein IT325_10350, partial [Anaerolineae bacterium]|nr:hypothetical protein [Anaerolineae bacterium]
MTGSNIQAMLHDTKLFQKLDADALAYIASLITVVDYRPGQYLFYERSA